MAYLAYYFIKGAPNKMKYNISFEKAQDFKVKIDQTSMSTPRKKKKRNKNARRNQK